MGSIKLSVIVAAYNAEQYIEGCLRSIMTQTFRDLEILVVNDGSTDSTLSICERLESEDARIRVINKQNGGVAAARNAGLEAAVGEFIGFVDADDAVHETMYEQLIDALEHHKADIAICGYQTVADITTAALSQPISAPTPVLWTRQDVQRNNIVQGDQVGHTVWNRVYRRIQVGDIRFRNYRVAEDSAFNYDCYAVANKVVYLPEKLYYYRETENSLSRPGSFNVARLFDQLNSWEGTCQRIEDDAVRRLVYDRYLDCIVVSLVLCLKEKDKPLRLDGHKLLVEYLRQKNLSCGAFRRLGTKRLIQLVTHRYLPGIVACFYRCKER